MSTFASSLTESICTYDCTALEQIENIDGRTPSRHVNRATIPRGGSFSNLEDAEDEFVFSFPRDELIATKIDEVHQYLYYNFEYP